MLDLISNPNAWVALLTLTFLEIVLGVDNIVFLSIVTGKLPDAQQPKARRLGLGLAMLFRMVLLFGITWVLGLQKPFWEIETSWLALHLTGQSLIIATGGLFLLYKAVTEIHHKLEGDAADGAVQGKASFGGTVLQIALLNIVFSFDSILTAVGLISLKPVAEGGFGYEGGLAIMMLSIVISIVIMMIFAGPVSRFVNQHPSIQMLGLSFLILIGVMLVAEGAHLAHLQVGASGEVGTIPKGYLYFSIFFSLFVEFLNLRLRKKQQPVKLHQSDIQGDAWKDHDPTN